MELDELKSAWEAQSHALNSSMRLNTALLERINLRTAERKLGITLRGAVVQVVLNAIAVLLIGSFAGDHAADARYLVPAVVLGLFAIALTADAAQQAVAICAIDYDEPVVAIQERLLRLRARRLASWMWTLALAPLMWVPLSIVAFRGLFGIDVYTVFGLPYVAANAAFGAAVFSAVLIFARRGQQWFERYPTVKSLMDDISGRSLTQALNSLDAIERFRLEDPAA